MGHWSHCDKDALRHKDKHLIRQYNDIKVLQQSGQSWEETGEMVTTAEIMWVLIPR